MQQTIDDKIRSLQNRRRYVRLARYLAKRCPSPAVTQASAEIVHNFQTELTKTVSDMNKNEVLVHIQELAQLARV